MIYSLDFTIFSILAQEIIHNFEYISSTHVAGIDPFYEKLHSEVMVTFSLIYIGNLWLCRQLRHELVKGRG